MLATYPVKIINNQIEWVGTPPMLESIADAIIVLSDNTPNDVASLNKKTKRQPPKALQGLMTTRGDIFDMSESYQEWENVE